MRKSARWTLRLLLAGAAAVLTSIVVLRGADGVTTTYLTVQTDVLKVIGGSLANSAAQPRRPLNLVFFGDSLTMGTDWQRSSIPACLKLHLGNALGGIGSGTKAITRFTNLSYSGLSIWSLYYVTDSIIEMQPDLAVLEFNLYNFSPFWHTIEHKPLSGMLSLGRFSQVQTLPVSVAGFATDQWLFHRLILKLGLLQTYNAVELEQARLSEVYWILSDKAAKMASPRMFTLREYSRLLRLKDQEYADPIGSKNTRSKAESARLLIGNALAGVRPDDAALRMLDAIVDAFTSAGIRTAVYIPPYNMEHLGSLGLLERSHLEDTIAQVRGVVERRGGSLIDLHATLTDSSFRDAMDHLRDMEPSNGIDATGQALADALTDDARRIISSKR